MDLTCKVVALEVNDTVGEYSIKLRLESKSDIVKSMYLTIYFKEVPPYTIGQVVNLTINAAGE